MRAMRRIAHCEHIIRRMRPSSTWMEVLDAINAAHPREELTIGKLMRAVHDLVDNDLLPKEIVDVVAFRPRGPGTGRRERKPGKQA